MDGLQVCNAIKSDTALASIPIMLITSATADSEVADGFWKIGTNADDFLSKPFNPFELAARVDRLVLGIDIPVDIRSMRMDGATRVKPK
jgi:DNA-binding response OmpR family regulator